MSTSSSGSRVQLVSGTDEALYVVAMELSSACQEFFVVDDPTYVGQVARDNNSQSQIRIPVLREAAQAYSRLRGEVRAQFHRGRLARLTSFGWILPESNLDAFIACHKDLQVRAEQEVEELRALLPEGRRRFEEALDASLAACRKVAPHLEEEVFASIRTDAMCRYPSGADLARMQVKIKHFERIDSIGLFDESSPQAVALRSQVEKEVLDEIIGTIPTALSDVYECLARLFSLGKVITTRNTRDISAAHSERIAAMMAELKTARGVVAGCGLRGSAMPSLVEILEAAEEWRAALFCTDGETCPSVRASDRAQAFTGFQLRLRAHSESVGFPPADGLEKVLDFCYPDRCLIDRINLVQRKIADEVEASGVAAPALIDELDVLKAQLGFALKTFNPQPVAPEPAPPEPAQILPTTELIEAPF